MAAAASLPDFASFDVDAEPTSLGVQWKRWKERFDNLLVALNIDEDNRKKALMLYYGGSGLHELYASLTTDANEGYAAAATVLSTHFEPAVNLTFEVYSFRSMKQEEESVAQYTARLKECKKMRIS